jgi:hypothetical protein
MSKLKIILILLAFFTVFYTALDISAQEESYDYILIVDKSGSMAGLPHGSGNPVIFPDVQEQIIKFIEKNVLPQMNIVIIPFSGKVVETDIFKKTPVKSRDDVNSLKEYVKGLIANGQVTWINYAVETALEEGRKLKEICPDKKHIQTIYLYTDGHDNSPEYLTLESILKKFSMMRGEAEHLYLRYVLLGPKLPGHEKELIDNTVGAKIIEVDKGKDVPPIVGSIAVLPKELNLQNLYTKHGKGTANLAFVSSQRDNLEKVVVLDTEFPDGVELSINPQNLKVSLEPQKIEMQLLNEIKENKYEGKILLSPLWKDDFFIDPKEIKVFFRYIKPKEVNISPNELNFGNLYKTGGKNKRKIVFNYDDTWVEGKDISVLGDFNIAANILPRKLGISDQPKDLELLVSHISGLKEGDYEGNIRLIPELGEDLIIAPREIKVSFSYKKPCYVTVDPSSLDFKNLYASEGKGSKKIRFTYSKSAISGKRIKIKPEFPAGVDANVSPNELIISEKPAEITLQISNPDSLKHGEYAGGVLLFSESEQELVIKPEKIALIFEYREPPSVTLRFLKDFVFIISRGGGDLKKVILVEFNETARIKNEKIQLELINLDKGSNVKIPSHVYLTTDHIAEKTKKITIDKDTEKVFVNINISKKEMPSIRSGRIKFKLIYHSGENVDVKLKPELKTSLRIVPPAFAEEGEITFVLEIEHSFLYYGIIGIITSIGIILILFVIFLSGRKMGWWQSYNRMRLEDDTGIPIKLRDKQIRNRWYSPKLTIGSRKQNIDVGASGSLATLELKGGRCFITPEKKGFIKVNEKDVEKSTKLFADSVIEISGKKLIFKA